MKSNSANILSILSNDVIGTFMLVELQFNIVYRYTTLPYDVSWNGNSYVSETNLLSFEPPRATTVVDRQPYRIQLSGMDGDMLAEIDQGIIHKAVRIRMGFTVDGVPQLGLNDIMFVYAGTVANISKSVKEGTQILTLECSAPLSYLDAKSTLFTTRDGMRAFDPTDTSFNQIFEGSTAYNISWGKKDAAGIAPTSPPFPPPDWLSRT